MVTLCVYFGVSSSFKWDVGGELRIVSMGDRGVVIKGGTPNGTSLSQKTEFNYCFGEK